LPYLLKALYYLIVFGIVGYLVWRYRAEVLAAIQAFLQSLREFWEKLFGSRREVSPEAALPTQPVALPTPFADFADPFSSGQAGSYLPEELVVYTFRAVEAWAREHDCPRLEHQTPHEFAAQIADHHEAVGQQTLGLAELYCAVAYSERNVDPRRTGQLAGLWRVLRETPATPLVASV
jgi:hypothetical protein